MKFYDEGLNQEELKNEYLKANSRCKFKNSEELISQIQLYFYQCRCDHKPYTISGLALFLWLSTETLRRYEKEYGDTEYADIIKFAKQQVEVYAEEGLYDKSKSSGAKFVLQNNFGWAEKQDVNQSLNVKLEDVLWL